jgi:hypothetical protein
MENIQFTQVQSSNIISVGHDGTNLYVKYKSGTYVYENVDKSIYESLLNSDSKGKFMNENIKGRYNYSRV